MTEMERTPHAQPRASGSVCSSSRRFAESSDRGIVPSPGTCSCRRQTLALAFCYLGVRMETTTLGDEPGLFPLLPRAGGIGGRMLSPLGHAAELMSSHSRRNERRLALTGSPRLGATALSKELIFTGTFSPNKAVFGTDDTSRPRTQQPAAGEGAAPGKVGKGLLCPVFPRPPRCQGLFFKVLGSASHGQDGRGGRRSAFPAGLGGSLPPTPSHSRAAQNSWVPQRDHPSYP